MTAPSRRPLRFAKAAVATAAAIVLLVGPPLFLWWVSDRRVIPDVGPGGFTDIWATLRAGQVPDKGVLLLCVALGWMIWCYLAAVFLFEFVAVWRDRAAGVQVRDLSGVRWMMSKLAGWILAGNTAVVSAFIVTPDFALPPDEIALVIDQEGVGEGPAAATAETGREEVFNPEAFLDFTGDEAPGNPISGLDRSSIPVNYERPIVKGDNLWDIAESLTGDGMNYHDIWAATDLGALVPEVDPRNPDLIFPGNVVQVPTRLMSDVTIEELFGEQPRLEAIEEPPDEEPRRLAPEEEPEPAPVEQQEAPPAAAAAARAPAANAQGGLNSSVIAAGAGLLGVAASAVILAGLVRRRRRRLASAPGNRRPNRADRRAIDAENRLKARLGHQIWAPDELAAAWNTMHPEDPGASQPWCVRWNADLNVLEAAWTTDPLRPPEAGRAPTVPADDSPWTLVTKEDRTGAKKEIWTIAERDVPSRPQVDAVPAMVGCADGRGDRPSDDGFWMNLEAAGTIAVETAGREAVDPAGVVRSFLLQMQANAPVELYLLNTDLGLSDLEDDVFRDPLALESTVVTEITAAQDSWDQYDSVYALRADGRFAEGTKVVVGPSEDLQSCSHVLSLARAANIPVVVIGLGPMSQAWATFVLEPAPEKHTIRFHEADAVVTFDHLSWASIQEADAIRLMIREASDPSAPPTDAGPGLDSFDLPPLSVELEDGSSALAAPGPANEPGWGAPVDRGASGWPEGASGDNNEPEPALVTASPFPSGDGADASATTGWHRGSGAQDSAPVGGESVSTALLDQPAPSSPLGDVDLSDPEPTAAEEAVMADVPESAVPSISADAEVDLLPTLDDSAEDVSLEPNPPVEGGAITAESQGSDDLWDSLPAADPGSLAGDEGGSGEETASYDWAVGTSDDEIDDIFGKSGMLSLATHDDLEADGDDEDLEQRLADALADTSNLSPGDDLASVTQALGTRMDNALDEQPPASASAGSSGLRLEVCGPIRLMREGPDGELQVVPMSGTAGGLTAGQLAMFALLGYHSKPTGGGIPAEEIATAFWSPFHKDGSLRQVPAGTVKKKVYELRAAVKSLLPEGDGKSVIPEAVDQRYSLTGVSCDWHELKDAIIGAEAGEVGTDEWIRCAEVIMGLIQPPGLFTVPSGKRAAPMFLWVEEYESIAQDAVRRLGNILVDYADYVSESGQRREALRILGKAREASQIYTWEVANAFVHTLLLDGDVGGARAECEAYERQLEAGEDQDVPGSPRRMLNNYFAGNASAGDQH